MNFVINLNALFRHLLKPSLQKVPFPANSVAREALCSWESTAELIQTGRTYCFSELRCFLLFFYFEPTNDPWIRITYLFHFDPVFCRDVNFSNFKNTRTRIWTRYIRTKKISKPPTLLGAMHSGVLIFKDFLLSNRRGWYQKWRSGQVGEYITSACWSPEKIVYHLRIAVHSPERTISGEIRGRYSPTRQYLVGSQYAICLRPPHTKAANPWKWKQTGCLGNPSWFWWSLHLPHVTIISMQMKKITIWQLWLGLFP